MSEEPVVGVSIKELYYHKGIQGYGFFDHLPFKFRSTDSYWSISIDTSPNDTTVISHGLITETSHPFGLSFAEVEIKILYAYRDWSTRDKRKAA